MKKNLKRARFWARLCCLSTIVQFVFCLAGILLSAPAPDGALASIGWAWTKLALGGIAVASTMFGAYRSAYPPVRVDVTRYIALAVCLDGLTDVANYAYPSEWHRWLWAFAYPYSFFGTLAIIYSFHFPGGPRKKFRFKAKWPSWAKARWSPTPRHHRPSPQPHPRPATPA